MNTNQFSKTAASFFSDCLSILEEKGRGYTQNDQHDRLLHFKRCGAVDGETPEQALKGQWKKHLVSVLDIVKMTEECPNELSIDFINEKLMDSVNYHALLYGLLMDRLKKEI